MQVAIYPYRVRFDNDDRLLLWMTNGQTGKDQFKVGKDGRLFVARDRRDAMHRLGTNVDLVKWKEAASLDIDEFWTKANTLRPGRKSSTLTCKVLLEGWNFFDDVLSTLSKNDLLEASKAPNLKKVYDKLFHGNNLQSINQSPRSYHPEWKAREIAAFREAMHQAWDAVRDEIRQEP